MSEPARVRPTYDGANRPAPFTVETREGNRQLRKERISDPFVNTTFKVRGWRNALRVLFRRYECSVVVSGDHDVVEDVMALDADRNVIPTDRSMTNRLKRGQLVKVHGDDALRARVSGWEWTDAGWLYKVDGEDVPIQGGPFSLLELAPVIEHRPPEPTAGPVDPPDHSRPRRHAMADHGSERHLAGLRDEAEAESDPLG